MTARPAPATFSVVIPTCDRPMSLREAVKSVTEQTRRPDEMIVVDNGTARIDPRILAEGVRVVTAPTQAGASQARNIGAVYAESDYLAFLDDDDTWEREYLNEIADAIRGGSRVLLGALCDQVSGKPLAGKNKTAIPPLAAWYRRNHGLVGSNLVIDRELFLNIGGFDASLRAAEDVDLAIRLLKDGRAMTRVPKARSRYDRSVSTDSLSTLHSLVKARHVFLRKHLANPVVRWLLLGEYVLRLMLARSRRAYSALSME